MVARKVATTAWTTLAIAVTTVPATMGMPVPLPVAVTVVAAVKAAELDPGVCRTRSVRRLQELRG